MTKGDDHVSELFGEIEVPLLAGLPAIESFTVNASVRAFEGRADAGLETTEIVQRE